MLYLQTVFPIDDAFVSTISELSDILKQNSTKVDQKGHKVNSSAKR